MQSSLIYHKTGETSPVGNRKKVCWQNQLRSMWE